MERVQPEPDEVTATPGTRARPHATNHKWAHVVFMLKPQAGLLFPTGDSLRPDGVAVAISIREMLAKSLRRRPLRQYQSRRYTLMCTAVFIAHNATH